MGSLPPQPTSGAGSTAYTNPISELSLEIVEGSDAGKQIPLTGPIEIGRDQSVAVVLNDGLVSRHHARLDVEGGKAVVEDLESLNGTFVNGVQIHARVPLDPGDQVLAGTTVIQVRTSEEVAVQPSVVLPVPPALATPARRPDYVPPAIARDARAAQLDELLDVKIKKKARVAPIGIFVLVVLAILILIALRAH
jgi:pSer/pThr/pTyr-binding forkhead associated (FHA) protein